MFQFLCAVEKHPPNLNQTAVDFESSILTKATTTKKIFSSMLLFFTFLNLTTEVLQFWTLCHWLHSLTSYFLKFLGKSTRRSGRKKGFGNLSCQSQLQFTSSPKNFHSHLIFFVCIHESAWSPKKSLESAIFIIIAL